MWEELYFSRPGSAKGRTRTLPAEERRLRFGERWAANHRGNQTSTFRTFNFLFTEWLIEWPASCWDDETLSYRFHSLHPPSWKGLNLNTVNLVQTLLASYFVMHRLFRLQSVVAFPPHDMPEQTFWASSWIICFLDTRATTHRPLGEICETLELLTSWFRPLINLNNLKVI